MATASKASTTPMTWEMLVDALLADVDGLAERTMTRAVSELRTYHRLSPADLTPAAHANTRAVLAALRDGRLPADGDVEEFGATFAAAGELRARQGVGVGDVLQGWRLGSEEAYRLAGRLLEGQPRRDALLLRLLEGMVTWGDWAMLQVAEGHRQTELELSRQALHERANLVRQILFGAVAPAELAARAEAQGLDVSAEYYAVRARCGGDVEPRHVERYLHTWDSGDRRRGLTALIDGDICGFVGRLPHGEAPTAIGVSERAPLHALVEPFRRASRALETALTFGKVGLFDLPSLGLLPAVAADHDLGQALTERYIEPFVALGASGQVILETVERYLANESRLDVTASDLSVHPNTVRYRLTRFEEVGGGSLRSHEIIAEVWWVLQRRHVDRASKARGGRRT